MKSCRNCEHSRGDGYYRTQLICRVTKQVVVPYSTCEKENKASDTGARKIAKTCPSYIQDGETK